MENLLFGRRKIKDDDRDEQHIQREHEPLHTLVEEAEIDNSNLNSFASFKELEMYLEKANICINMKEMYLQLEKFKPRLEEHDDQGTKDDHVKLNKTNGSVNKEEDQGLDQKAPNPVEEKDIYEVNLEEETPKPSHKEEDDIKIDDHEALNPVCKDEDHAVVALPLSLRLPHDPDAVTSAMNNKKLATRSQMKSKRALSAGNIIDQTKSGLLKNWTIQPRQRTNGKFDKEQDIIAAKPSTSSQEIEINTPESFDRVTGTALDLEKDDACMNKIMPYYDFEVDDQPKIYVEAFLNDSFNNLINTTFSDDPKSSTLSLKGSKKKRIEASSEETEEKCGKATVAAKPIISSKTRDKKRSQTLPAANDSKSKKAHVNEEYDLDDLQLLDIPVTILDSL
ncbi:hypothetical protein FNV43_RR10617 [Rhamnella rubrinervis]|uniref:Uncharacterized protein n=1 Tax=Rhamnella rubrinervis TaxID=2594499 RepID=A0A8K0H433_9ROSA|nr:hypothetical protein FNV43_RR10617 [Rhamnella rubrinervis]